MEPDILVFDKSKLAKDDNVKTKKTLKINIYLRNENKPLVKQLQQFNYDISKLQMKIKNLRAHGSVPLIALVFKTNCVRELNVANNVQRKIWTINNDKLNFKNDSYEPNCVGTCPESFLLAR